ncbi:MAG: hypothetical protein HY028_11870 [Gammaproteobacteria bacterium]|nr:hypothetical protein [Gammaproteobacteria bacterium]
MGFLGLTAGMLLPWLLGVVWLRVLWRDRGAKAWPVWLGYGYVLGALVTTLVMRLLDLLGIPFSFVSISLPLVAITTLGAPLHWKIPLRNSTSDLVADSWRNPIRWQHTLFIFLFAIIILRFAGLGLEIIWRPLFAWDAWSQWATKARVWYELGRLVPFVPADIWLSSGATQAYTDSAPHYPATIPLLQVWMSYSLGRWDDSLMNLPWLQCGIALGLAFYGQARLWGVSPLAAMIFTYFLLSLPLLDTHIALAGYADLFMATVYGLAAMAFFHWARTRDHRQGLLALLLVLSCPLIKIPGQIWMLTFLPALWVALMPRTGMIGVALVGGAALFLLGRTQLVILGYTLHTEFSPVGEPILKNMFVMDNWHLFWYLFIALWLFALTRLFSAPLRVMTILVLTDFYFLAIVFFFSKAHIWVADFSTLNRALLHIVPMLMFYMMVLYREGIVLPRWLTVHRAPT